MSEQRIPTHTGETMTFTPAVLLEEAEPPVFKLKAVGWREREDMEYAVAEAGLRQYSEEHIRETTIDELCRLWEWKPEDDVVQRVRKYWADLDDYVAELDAHAIEVNASLDAGGEPPPDLAPFEHEDRERVADLSRRLTETSPIMRKIGISNIRYRRDFPRYTIAHCVRSWTGISVPPSFEGGVLTLDAVVALQDHLVETYGDEKGEAAFLELATATLKRIYLVKATEKNSASLASSQPTPQATKDDGSAKISGKSQASESSEPTPDA